jgi:hypothetical protein
MEAACSGNWLRCRACRRNAVEAALRPADHTHQCAEGACLETQRHVFQRQVYLVATLAGSHMADLAADQQLTMAILVIHESSLQISIATLMPSLNDNNSHLYLEAIFCKK